MNENIDIHKEFLRSMAKIQRLAHRKIQNSKIPFGEFMTLKTINNLEISNKENLKGVKTSEISKFLCMKKPATSKMLNALEEKNYIKRIADKSDRRVVYISLTDEGRQFLQCEKDGMREYLNKITNKLGEEEMKNLIDLLSKLYDVVEEIEEEK